MIAFALIAVCAVVVCVACGCYCVAQELGRSVLFGTDFG